MKPGATEAAETPEASATRGTLRAAGTSAEPGTTGTGGEPPRREPPRREPPGREPPGPGRGPRWLSRDEHEVWIRLAGLLVKLPAALDAQLQRDAGLSHFEYMVLAALSEAPGRTLRLSDLAELASGSLSRLSHVVTRLERREWVRREPCPGDGRYINAVLTDDGWAKVVATAPGHVATVRALVIDALGPEQLRQLPEITDRIMSRVAPEGACGRPPWPGSAASHPDD